MKLQEHERLQWQHDLIQQYFKATTEPYDDLEWDGKTCMYAYLVKRLKLTHILI